MFLSDYHTHTRFSIDGEAEIYDSCRAAIAKGFSEIAFTDHEDIYSLQKYDYVLNCAELYPALLEAREHFCGQLRVVIGAELGQPMANPAAARNFIREHPELDFIIGSIHNMEHDLDVYYYNFRKHAPAQVYDHYLDRLMELASDYDYDVIGHITYPLRYMAEAGFAIDMHPFLEKIEALYRTVVRRGKGIELNVSGLRQSMQTTMPTPMLLKLYRDCGGEILTIGSDAHRACDVGSFIRTGQEIALECGFTTVTSFENRRPVFHKLEF